MEKCDSYMYICIYVCVCVGNARMTDTQAAVQTTLAAMQIPFIPLFPLLLVCLYHSHSHTLSHSLSHFLHTLSFFFFDFLQGIKNFLKFITCLQPIFHFDMQCREMKLSSCGGNSTTSRVPYDSQKLPL